MLPTSHPVKELVEVIASRIHSDDYFGAARAYAEFVTKATGSKPPCANKTDADVLLTTLLHWLLENNGYEEAAQLLWGPTLFDPRPESTRRVWAAFEEKDLILLMGAGSMSKSYSMGVRLFLEWVRDPEYTTVKVVGPSEDHLESNLFTHLVTLHRQATIPLPGNPTRLFIGGDPRLRKGSIAGVVVPLGKAAAGRLQGVKRVPRKKPHPKFGKLSRLFVFLDEIANIPMGIWRDIDNVITNMAGDGGLKIIGAFNPTDQEDEVGKRCEPEDGWEMFDEDSSLDWVSRRGWRVVRLDAARCENVLEKRVIYPGLQTYEGFQALIQNSGGTDSPGYYSMGRGCFPPTGTSMSVVSSGLLSGVRVEPIWYETPSAVGGVDLAFEGGDTATFVKGSFGLASGIRFAPSVDYPNGRILMFRDARENLRPRYLLVAESMLKLPKGDTIEMAEEVKRVARSFGIKPAHLCIDKTGHGSGTFDLIRSTWSEVIGVNYSESSTEQRILSEDKDVPHKEYSRINSELWFAVRKFLEFGFLKFDLGFSPDRLTSELTGRRYRMQGKKSHVEQKKDYKSRNAGRSPDEADALTLLVHAVRFGFSFIGSMTADGASADPTGDYDDYDDKPRIDVTNRFEDL